MLIVPRSLFTTRVAKGFAFDVFGNDHQGFAQPGNLFQQRKQILQVADSFENQDVRIAQATLHRVTVGDEIGREIPLVELHTLNNIESCFNGFGFFDSDGSILANLSMASSDDLTDGRIPVSGNRCHLLDFFLVLHLLGNFGQLTYRGIDCFGDATLDANRVRT